MVNNLITAVTTVITLFTICCHFPIMCSQLEQLINIFALEMCGNNITIPISSHYREFIPILI